MSGVFSDLLLIAQIQFYERVWFELHLVHVSVLILQNLHRDTHRHGSQREIYIYIHTHTIKAAALCHTLYSYPVSTVFGLENVPYQQFGLQQNL